MNWPATIRVRLRMLLPWSSEDEEMDEELRFHIEMETEANVRRGMSPEEARRRAIISFGGLERRREEMRADRGVPLLTDLGSDLRQAVRSLRRQPGIALVIVMALGVGIGASVAVFSVVRQLVTHAVPFTDAERLLSVNMSGPRGIGMNPRYEDYRIWRTEAASLATLGGYVSGPSTIGNGLSTSFAVGFRVTESFFPILGVRPLLGRLLSAADHGPEAEPVVVLSRVLWEREFGADPDVVGQAVSVGGQPHIVVGVIDRGDQFPSMGELWTPLVESAAMPSGLYLSTIGRLVAGTGEAELRSSIATIQAALDAERPENERAGRVSIMPLTGAQSPSIASGTLLLRGAVLLLLLIGIANATGLLITRGVSRRREVALLTSLGASRGRIARRFLAEGTVLAAAGGLIGILVAHLIVSILRASMPASMTRQMLGWDQLGIDDWALGLAIVFAGVTGILCGAVPSLRVGRTNLVADLRSEELPTTLGHRESWLSRVLLAGQVALALTMLLTAGLMARSLVHLVGTDLGFPTEDLLTVQWALPTGRYESDAEIRVIETSILERITGLPAVTSAGIVSHPPTARFGTTRGYRMDGSAPAADESIASWRPVSVGYLESMSIPLLSGRGFTLDDGPAAPAVAIVDESLAARHWSSGTGPVGDRIVVDEKVWTIVGVARDTRGVASARPHPPTIYIPSAQSPVRAGFLVARTTGDPTALAPHIQREIWELDHDVAIGPTQSMTRIIADAVADERVMAILVVVFASCALVITMTSLYAMVAHAAARRRREFGIRLALGAGAARILAGAVRQGMVWVGIGALIGILFAAGIAQLISGMLYGVQPLDPLVFSVVTGGLLAIALIASCLPARAALRVDPMICLRGD